MKSFKQESTRCPFCHCKESEVKETRKLSPFGLMMIIRIRVCRYCRKRFRTKEIVDDTDSTELNHRYSEEEKAPPKPDEDAGNLKNPFI